MTNRMKQKIAKKRFELCPGCKADCEWEGVFFVCLNAEDWWKDFEDEIKRMDCNKQNNAKANSR